MNCIVFGANGKTGRYVVDYAKQRGFEVTAFVHSDRGDLEDVRVVEGDVRDDLTSVLKGVDVIFYAIGHGKNTPDTIVTDGIENILKYSNAKIVAVTGAQVFVHGDKDTLWTKFSRFVFRSVATKRFDDGQKMTDVLLKRTDNVVLIRSPRMSLSPFHEYTLGGVAVGLFGSVSHMSTAHAMVEVASKKHWLGTAPCIRKRR